MALKPKVVISGTLSMLPGASMVHRSFFVHPNPAPADASYGVWLKHLCLASAAASLKFPTHIAELGPGHSIGVGLAALISGAESYWGFDVIPFVERARMPEVFDRLVVLFKERTSPANASLFPNYQHLLDANGFPSDVLSDAHMDSALAPDRLRNLRKQVLAFAQDSDESEHPSIRYRAPWNADDRNLNGTFDLILSHTVMQHVVELEETVRVISRWLRPGAATTHQIDFGCLGVAKKWNGHWACPAWQWRLALGRKGFLINRIPASGYVDFLEKAGLNVSDLLRLEDSSGHPRESFSEPWRQMPVEDAVTRGGFIVARQA